MSPEDIEKLLGGYATGTLTAEERQALFAAALEDQELFDALAREQSLRDLLRDPAARAELLSALDVPRDGAGGFWAWSRRPAVAGFAAAGVTAIAAVAVWQGVRTARLTPAQPVTVAELRPQESAPPPAVPSGQLPSSQPPLPPPPVGEPKEQVKEKIAFARAEPTALKKTPAPPPPAQSDTATLTRGAENAPAAVAKDAAPAVATPPLATPGPSVAALAPPPPPVQAVMARKAETEGTLAAAAPAPAGGAAKKGTSADARALFYANLPATGANAFAAGSGGAAPASILAEAPQADAAGRTAKALSDLAAPVIAANPLGVRISILRAAGEADLTAVLDPGETVRLKLIPNADGFLYVTEGARLLASGAARHMQPFETPELRFEGGGKKQLQIVLSRQALPVSPQSLGTVTTGNLVESTVEQERATYIVNGPRDTAARQVTVPVTLTWR